MGLPKTKYIARVNKFLPLGRLDHPIEYALYHTMNRILISCSYRRKRIQPLTLRSVTHREELPRV